MKPIHKRLYTVIPRPIVSTSCPATPSPISRVRSNSASSCRSLYTVNTSTLSFFDSPPPPPPSSRPGNPNIVVTTRLPAEVKAEIENQADSPYSNTFGYNAPQSQVQSGGPLPYSLALTSGHSESPLHLSAAHHKPFFPYSSFAPSLSYGSGHPPVGVTSEPYAKRQRTRYQLDVGAYGIPKRSHGSCIAGRNGHGKLGVGENLQQRGEQNEGLNRAVQVGEDAYFVRDNAMGVADGVGGWSRLHRSGQSGVNDLSPSALFARRLMHYCSEEVEVATTCYTPVDHLDLDDATVSEAGDLYAELEDSLEELEDGLDVLMILERAYEKTMHAHVQSDDTDGLEQRDAGRPLPSFPPHDLSPSSIGTTRSTAVAQATMDTDPAPAISPNSHHFSWSSVLSPIPQTLSSSSLPSPRPLTQGSSTALLAILEHPRVKSQKVPRQSTLFGPQPQHIESMSSVADRGAVIRIAHLGDCMGMLIRGEEIAWRTEEMWWNFNTPVQLGPTSPTRPQDARVFTVPVQADDILILASDGLSDNLWDEDVLDEVVRFRRPFIANRSWSQPSEPNSTVQGVFCRSTLAAMLSEALCSRARRASERRGCKGVPSSELGVDTEVPFARRAREQGKSFHGGKPDGQRSWCNGIAILH
ncbi:hypothetical protein AcV7_004836 [Taiwanofungus camphoratus]|nr:hypothetical protein AcV7_004836 [Antrodia cinnamomea]